MDKGSKNFKKQKIGRKVVPSFGLISKSKDEQGHFH